MAAVIGHRVLRPSESCICRFQTAPTYRWRQVLETVIHPRRISARRARHGVGTPVFLIEQIADGESEVQIFAVSAEHGVGADEAGKRGDFFVS